MYKNYLSEDRYEIFKQHLTMKILSVETLKIRWMETLFFICRRSLDNSCFLSTPMPLGYPGASSLSFSHYPVTHYKDE